MSGPFLRGYYRGRTFGLDQVIWELEHPRPDPKDRQNRIQVLKRRRDAYHLLAQAKEKK